MARPVDGQSGSIARVSKIGNDPGDPRRLAFLLIVPGIAWALHYLWPDNGFGFWLLGSAVFAVVIMLVPLPPWRESPNRRWAVVALYAGLSLVIATAASAVHLLATRA